MLTYENSNHSFIERLRERAADSEKAAAATITAGCGSDDIICSWKANGMDCRVMPDDEQGISRISIGGGDHLPVKMNYLVVRGKVSQCIALLEKALVALRRCPE